MTTVKFRTKASTQDLAIRELRRGIPEEITVESVKPSKMSEQDVIIVLSTPAEKWSGKAWATINNQARSRAIHLIQGK